MRIVKKRMLSLLLSLCLIISLVPLSVFATDADEKTNVIDVPSEAMVIVGGTYYGISKSWFEANNPAGEKLFLSIHIPDSVTTICKEGFRDSWSSDKQKFGCITNYNYDGDKTYTDKYAIVNIDFSNAKSLITIDEQAALGCSLSGVLDLSGTKVETIGMNAFRGCTGMTGVILPSTLKNIGSTSSGSVFYGCSGLQFVRTAGKNPEAVFELPDHLEVLGNQAFYKCTGLPADTAITIPASVTYVGNEVFNYTPSITTIVVKTNDASHYHGKAFSDSTNKYGVGNRLIVFNNSAAKKTFTPSGSTKYKNSLTYEFTLHYGDHKDALTEAKLYGQSVNVCKYADGSWSFNEEYQIPEAPSENAPVGYDGSWEYNGNILTSKTVLKPDGDDLYLDTGFVLQNPTIEFVVDGNVIETETTYPKLNLSNNKEHTIGVTVTHPVETAEDADVRVKFEYEWTDVWESGRKGPRMKESGFGRYQLWDNPDVTNTITVNGPEHERTSAGNYSGEDYGDGYYLLEVYGYYMSKTGGPWKLFYKSASTIIGSDPERTVNTAYTFDVITSAPAEIPVVFVEDLAVGYGYEKADFIAAVHEQEGYIYTYQWYAADGAGQTKDGRKIEGAAEKVYSVPVGKDAGNYYYYLEITAQKTDNGDTAAVAVPVKMTVTPKTITVLPNEGQKKYFGQPDPMFAYTLSEDCDAEITGALEREAGEEIGRYVFTMGTLASDNPNYELKLTEENIPFVIEEYKVEAIFSPEQPDGDDDWYSSGVTVTPPDSHAMSIDGGQTWSTEPMILDEYDGDLEYLLRSGKEDDTKGAVARNRKPLKIDTTAPVIRGIEDEKTYCLETKFQAADKNLKNVTVNGQPVSPEDGFCILSAGKNDIIASDFAGNSIKVSVTVNAGHTFGDWNVTKDATETDKGIKEHTCSVCGYEETAEIPAAGISKKASASEGSDYYGDAHAPQTRDDSDAVLWIAFLFISGVSLVIAGMYKRKKHMG